MTALVAVLAVAAASAAALAWRAHREASAAQLARGHYELLAANLPDVSVLLYDRELRFTTLEGSALEAHGWRRDEIEGRPIEDVIPAGRVDDLMARCRAALAGEPSSQDWPGLRDGARYRLQHLPVRDPRGAVTGGMIVVREVSEQHRLQERVEAQSVFLAGVLEQLSDFVVACDADGRLQRFGDAPAADVDPLDWPAHFGLRRADGTTPLPAAEVPLFRALQGEEVADEELVAEIPGEGPRRIVASARPVRDAAGRLIGAVAVRADVTDSRETQSRLQASEERYRSVVESVGDTVFSTDLRGRWSFLNESFTRWTGIPVADALGRPAAEVVHPGDRAPHVQLFGALAAGEIDTARMRHRYLGADGVTRWAEVRARLTRDAAGRPIGIAGVIEDVTERHRTQQYEAAEQAVVDVLARSGGADDEPVARRDLVGELLAALCRTLDWDLAELWTLDGAREALVCTDAWGERRAGLEALEAARTGESFEVGDGLQGQAWARRVPIWASGLDEDPLFRRGAAASAAGIRSALALPVARAGEVLATILFFSRDEREPDPGLARLLQAIGAHLAQYLERRRA
ncbi:MAG TPA: PAS domain S-box protein, partial [Solirubrobacteraceae bacterium]|nr:PAS domain S-box protein [Solirubrobacteraceae bacterium]